MIRLPARFKAPTDPWTSLLADKQFWADFRADLARELHPLFLGIFAAGAIAASTIKPRTPPETREKALPAPELDAFLDIDALVTLGERTIGDYVNTFSKSIADDTYDQVRSAVLTSRRTGTGVEGVLKDITPLFSPRRAEVIAVTETTRLFGMGSQAVYRAQGFDGWEWMTVNDPRVDPACASMTGVTYPMDQEFEPKHPSCRCFPSPVVIGKAQPVAATNAYPEEGFRTIKEAEAWASAKYPHIQFDFTRAKIININPTLAAFDRMAAKYPDVAERLRAITTRPSQVHFPDLPRTRYSGFRGEMAHATVDGNMIALNPKFYSDAAFAEDVARQAKQNRVIGYRGNPITHLREEVTTPNPWHPLGTEDVGSVMIHEFGHQVDHWLASYPKSAAFDAVSADGRGLISDFQSRFKSKYLTRGTITDNPLSDYALKSTTEAWAEAFAQYYSAPEEVWHPSTKALGKYLDYIGNPANHVPNGRWSFVGDLPEGRAEANQALNDLLTVLGLD